METYMLLLTFLHTGMDTFISDCSVNLADCVNALLELLPELQPQQQALLLCPCCISLRAWLVYKHSQCTRVMQHAEVMSTS